MKQITQKRLKEVLHYDKATGLFLWKQKRGRQGAGSIAGSATGSGGYVRLMVDGQLYLAHRLVFLYVEGSMPKKDVDHRNGLRTDNRYANLRQVTRSTNNQNQRKPHPRSATGFLGVRLDKRYGRYYASIYYDGRKHGLGGYTTPEEAHAAYVAAKRKHHLGCTI
jgi:hypothetical protein